MLEFEDDEDGINESSQLRQKRPPPVSVQELEKKEGYNASSFKKDYQNKIKIQYNNEDLNINKTVVNQ
jgi:hypothetical protein